MKTACELACKEGTKWKQRTTGVRKSKEDMSRDEEPWADPLRFQGQEPNLVFMARVHLRQLTVLTPDEKAKIKNEHWQNYEQSTQKRDYGRKVNYSCPLAQVVKRDIQRTYYLLHSASGS